MRKEVAGSQFVSHLGITSCGAFVSPVKSSGHAIKLDTAYVDLSHISTELEKCGLLRRLPALFFIMANQAWQISAPGKLSLVDLGPAPEPGPRQVLVRVQAVALNYRDVLVINHDPAYIVPTSPNLVPCSDGAGVIEDVGAGSTWMKGDRIFFHPNNWQTGKDPRDWSIQKTMGGGPCDGTLRRYIIANDVDLVRAPDNLSIEEAATIYTAGVTAWNGLMHGLIKLKPGMTILTQGTGGVSCYAIQVQVLKHIVVPC